MPQQSVAAVQSNFTKGLITEFSALNFPENAATDTDNCAYTIIGNVTRRLGITEEVNGTALGTPRTNFALSDYKWDNAGGDGFTQLIVRQVGNVLFFYKSSTATVSIPFSQQLLGSSIDLNNFVVFGTGTIDVTLECQFSSGNGYLFVYHPNCTPFYVAYSAGTLTANPITIKIRDFSGVIDNIPVDTRPLTLSAEHQYNLTNQGWVQGNAWDINSGSANTISIGSKTFFIGAGIAGITLGQQIRILYETGGNCQAPFDYPVMSGTVTNYSGGTLTVNITFVDSGYASQTGSGWRIQPTSTAYLNAWFTAVGNYPSNSDVWWYFKNASKVFDPATTNQNVTIATGNAPRGRFILDAFNQQRATTSGISGLTSIKTVLRPKTGTWFQGRVWYTGVDASQAASGDANQYSWSENIYFSQTIVDTSQFGNCFQTNDPTSETLSDLLPTDGGVITLQGCGSIYKLFPIQNGLIVFTANGIKFITGSQGIGFTANDYTITDLSYVRSISCTSYVNVNGLPYFWNEEGIYAIEPGQKGGLVVNPITVGTILAFYNQIPVSCKKYARGAYNPIDYVIQWVYRDTEPGTTTDKYSFNRILNYNTYNKAFFPYSVDNTQANINGILYVTYPGGLDAPEPSFKYPSSLNNNNLIYADEHDESYLDWFTIIPGGVDYSSYFITGYQIRGQAQKTFFPGYIWVFSNSGPDFNTSYKINSIWDYASSGNTGRWSSERVVVIPPVNYGAYFRRHKVRGHGVALQFKIQSVEGKGFDIIGWSTNDNVNTGI